MCRRGKAYHLTVTRIRKRCYSFTLGPEPRGSDGKQATIGPGSIIFMPPNTGVRLTNDGKQPISLVAILSRPGFDKYLRDISVPAGETAKPLTAEELTAIRARHTGAVIYDPPTGKQR